MSVSFGDSIRRGREVAGLSQAKVAELIGKAPSTVRSWEMGRTNPSEAAAVSALAAVLGIDEPTLLSRAGFEVPEAAPRLTLEQEFEGLRTAVPTPIPPPDVPALKERKAKSASPRPALMALRLGPPRHLGSKALAKPVPPRLAAASVPEEASVEGEAASATEAITTAPSVITVVPPAEPDHAPREPDHAPRERKVTIVPAGASATARSYVEESEQREFYRWRTIATLVCLFVLFLAFSWALRNMGGAISDFIGSFIDQLNF